MSKFTCPCCGYISLNEGPGLYEICQICFWEDEPIQLLDPWYPGGANMVSLAKGQKNYIETGAADEIGLKNARGVSSTDIKDPQWRMVRGTDKNKVKKVRDLSGGEYGIISQWYYWL